MIAAFGAAHRWAQFSIRTLDRTLEVVGKRLRPVIRKVS
jgi:hypothetical protein